MSNFTLITCFADELYENIYYTVFAELFPYFLALILNFLLLSVSLFFYCSNYKKRKLSIFYQTSLKPGLALNCFILNCALSAFIQSSASFIYTIYTSFTSHSSQQGTKVGNYFSEFTIYALFDISHITFAFLLSINSLFYLLKPLHYHNLITHKRSVCICIFTWIFAVADALVMVIPAIDQAWKLTVIIVAKSVPVFFAVITSFIVTILIYRNSKNKLALSRTLSKRQPFWKRVLKIFQVPCWTLIFFCPSMIAENLYAFYEYDVRITTFVCSPMGATILAVTWALCNIYLCGVPVIIVMMHPIYWRQMKRFCGRMKNFISDIKIRALPVIQKY
jgi:hypothetical protein